MKTSDLIDVLARDEAPPSPRPGQLPMQLGLSIVLGLIVASVLLVPTLGVRSWTRLANIDVMEKLVFTAGIGLLAMPALLRTLRPGGQSDARVFLPLLPAAAIALAAIAQMIGDPATAVWRKDTPYCLIVIPLLSLPVLLLLAQAGRSFAPTDLPHAGLLTGLMAGSVAATIYALHCPNDDPVYLAAWYLPAIILSGLVGRAAGTRILSW